VSKRLGLDFIPLLNVVLRAGTLVGRFVLILFLAKFLDPTLFGYYGIFTVTAVYMLLFGGLDFYIYVSREIINTPPCQRGQLLKGQAALSGFLYLILFLPVIWFLVLADWPRQLVWWFFPIVLLEHLNQEITRLLVALSEQLSASLILFVRQGSWVIICIVLMKWNESARSLDVIMGLWAAAGLVAAGLGVHKLDQLKTGGWGRAIDCAWVRKGVLVSVPFLVSTLALRGVQTLDRYWLESLVGIEAVGAYALLFGIASTLLTLLDAALFSFVYPMLIQHVYRSEHNEVRRKVNLLWVQTIGLSAGFGLTSWFLLPYLLAWIGNPAYQEYIRWYPCLLSAMVLNGLGLVPHYALYALKRDNLIILSHFGSLPVFCVTTYIFSSEYSGFAVIIGLNAAFAAVLFLNAYSYWFVVRREASAGV
jgi:O-antigen/teichoic acid export membrane protein